MTVLIIIRNRAICIHFFNGFVYPANDECNLTQAWQAFSAQHHIPLHLCVAASQRRGVVDALTAKETDKTNLAEGFKMQA